MKAVFGRWRFAFLGLIMLQLLVILVVAVWLFGDSAFRPAYEAISRSPKVFRALNTIVDFSDIISGLVMCAGLIILFSGIRKYQHHRAVNRLHEWARNSVVLLAQFRQQSTGDHEPVDEKLERARLMIEKLLTSSARALTDARMLPGEVSKRVGQTVAALHAARTKLVEGNASLSDDLKSLHHDFAELMIAVFEYMK